MTIYGRDLDEAQRHRTMGATAARLYGGHDGLGIVKPLLAVQTHDEPSAPTSPEEAA